MEEERTTPAVKAVKYDVLVSGLFNALGKSLYRNQLELDSDSVLAVLAALEPEKYGEAVKVYLEGE